MRIRQRTSIGTALGLAVLATLLALAPACGREGDGPSLRSPVIGVKIYEAPPPFDGLFRDWRDLGVNALFISEALARNGDFRALAARNGLPLFIIFPVFQGPEAIKADPDLTAVTAEGAPARDEWVEFVCPAREDFLSRKVGELRRLVVECDPYAISLDFIRYFVFWEKIGPGRTLESLPQTCFCPVCLAGFEKEMGVRVPAEPAATAEKAKWVLGTHPAEWTEWKCRVIARAVERLASAVRSVKPGIKVNIHAVPWRAGDFGGAVKSVAGQDLARLAPFVDFISPMCYHHMVRRTPAWVHDVVEDIFARTRGAVLASTQVSKAYIEEELLPQEFQASVEEALMPPSIGVVLWSWNALAESPEKKGILKSLAGLKNRLR
jgi:hypothetical protein